MRRVMLDTNAYAALLSGDAAVREALAIVSEVLLPIIVVGELEAGFRGGTRYTENGAVFQLFLAKPGVRMVVCGHETSRIYGEVKDSLKRAGSPVPSNDIWIAASAIEHAAMLVTYDRHFASIRQVRLWHGFPNDQLREAELEYTVREAKQDIKNGRIATTSIQTQGKRIEKELYRRSAQAGCGYVRHQPDGVGRSGPAE